MTRNQAKNLVRLYDNQYPTAHINSFLSYYGISKETFDKNIDKWANKKLFKKIKNKWEPIFSIK